MAKLSPIGNNAQFINGIPANGAKLFTYAAGSSTKQTTYTDEAGTIPQTNPIILDSRGEPTQPIWLTEGLSYKFVFTASTDSDPPVSPIWDIDDVTGINDASISIDQWVDSGVQPTYVSATQFTLPGDQTSAFTVGRRGKFLVTAGTVYGTFSASVFGALTTVTVTMDSGQALDSGLSSVQLGLITPNNGSLPYNLSAGAIQNQQYTTFTTGGTSTAYTLTPTPALTALATGQRFNVTFNATAGATPTLAISGLTAKSLKYYDSTGAKQAVTSTNVIANLNSDVIYDGTDYIVVTPAGVVTFASNAEYVTGTEAAKALSPAVARARNLVAGTAIATTSGTSHDFTGIPSWAKRIVMNFSGVSVSGTSNLLIQIGDSGGIENTGYSSGAFDVSVIPNSTIGFVITPSNIATATWNGSITITLLDGFTWASAGVISSVASGYIGASGGSKALSAALDRIRLTTVNGTDTFDAGSINIIYE